MAELPTSVRIGACDYSVRVGHELYSAERLGICSADQLAITLRPNMHPQKECETFLHEILHGCYKAAGLDVGEEKHTEEQIVNAMACQWAQVMRDNPSLLAYVAVVFQHPNPGANDEQPVD